MDYIFDWIGFLCVLSWFRGGDAKATFPRRGRSGKWPNPRCGLCPPPLLSEQKLRHCHSHHLFLLLRTRSKIVLDRRGGQCHHAHHPTFGLEGRGGGIYGCDHGLTHHLVPYVGGRMVGMGTIINSRARLDPMFGSSRGQGVQQDRWHQATTIGEGEGGVGGR